MSIDPDFHTRTPSRPAPRPELHPSPGPQAEPRLHVAPPPPPLAPPPPPAPHHHYYHHRNHPHPRRQRWPWMVGGFLGLVAAVVIGSLIWYQVETQPANSNAKQPVSFQLASGTGVTALARQLAAQHIIKNANAFTVYVTLHGLRRDLEAGTYDLYPSDSVATIANILSHGKVTHDILVVPEGSTVTQIRTLAAGKGIRTADFNAALADSYPNSFLAGRPAGDTSLEGYLFPNSYQVTPQTSAHTLVAEMLTTFGQQVDQANLASAYAAHGLTLHQGLTLASIVEREAGTPADRPIIAQVFLKRLQMGMPLQSDVTVNYASELTGLPFSVTLDSPYNTYLHTGLPPGPIANPGLGSMEAVAHPANTDYLYFLADKNGVVHYAQTAQQHEANVQQYLSQ